MATWKIEPTWKKSVVEKQYWTKGDSTVVHEIGWRWGEFFIETKDDETPELDLDGDFDILECGYDCQNWSTDDGCWEDTDYDMSSEQQEELELFLEDNSVYDLEEDGWVMTECQMWITCPITMEKVK